MRKIAILLSAVLSALCFQARGEGLWGAKASFDINCPGKLRVGDTSVDSYRTGLGLSLGGVYTHYITDALFVEPSLSIFYDTYAHDQIVLNEGATPINDPTVVKVGLRLPVVVGWTFDITDDFALSLFMGPELNYAFAGGYRFKDQSVKETIDWPLFGKDGEQRRVSASWKGGVAFPFSDWRVDLEVAVGMTDLHPSVPSFKENRVSLSLLHYF